MSDNRVLSSRREEVRRGLRVGTERDLRRGFDWDNVFLKHLVHDQPLNR